MFLFGSVSFFLTLFFHEFQIVLCVCGLWFTAAAATAEKKISLDLFLLIWLWFFFLSHYNNNCVWVCVCVRISPDYIYWLILPDANYCFSLSLWFMVLEINFFRCEQNTNWNAICRLLLFRMMMMMMMIISKWIISLWQIQKRNRHTYGKIYAVFGITSVSMIIWWFRYNFFSTQDKIFKRTNACK